jgi:N-acetylglucosaminyldiphosphoundecaprenol N-acetyl-beta-D-mannosaminyltransferase
MRIEQFTSIEEIKIFGIKIHPFPESLFLSIIGNNLETSSMIVQNGINASTFVELMDNDSLRQAIMNSDLVNVDGISVLLALRFLGYKIPEHVPCPDLAEKILSIADSNKYSVFLLGARESDLVLCRKNLQGRYPNLIIAGLHDGYFEFADETNIVDLINSVKPDILLLGMPSPKKELFVERNKNSLNTKYCFGVGGYFDILSGSKKRAPKWMRRIGMEWFYRFSQEPGRLWKRYLFGNVKFIFLILKMKMKLI